jgi:hypothetical protein
MLGPTHATEALGKDTVFCEPCYDPGGRDELGGRGDGQKVRESKSEGWSVEVQSNVGRGLGWAELLEQGRLRASEWGGRGKFGAGGSGPGVLWERGMLGGGKNQ